MTGAATTRAEQRGVLEAFRKALRRAAHDLTRPWVKEFPEFFWQQMHNRLQWHEPANAIGDVIDAERARREGPDADLWLRVLTRPLESDALLRSLSGHGTRIWAACFSPDGGLMASAGLDDTVRMWRLPDGEQVACISWEEFRSPRSCAFSGDGTMLAAGGENGIARVFSVSALQELAVLRGHTNYVTSCCFTDDDRTLVTASHDGTVRIWDIASAEEKVCLSVDGPGRYDSVRVAPDRRTIVAAGSLEKLVLWRTTDLAEPVFLSGHGDWVHECCFSPDGSLIASCGNGGELRLWDAASGSQVWAVETGEGEMDCCAFSPDGTRLLTSGDYGELRLWDVRSGEPLGGYPGHSGGVDWCGYSPDGETLASAGQDGLVRLYDAAILPQPHGEEHHAEPVLVCSLSPDGRIAATGSLDGVVRVIDTGRLDTGRPSHAVVLPGDERGAFCLVVTSGGDRVVSGSADGWVRVWDCETGVTLVSSKVSEESIEFLAERADGHALIACTGSGPSLIRTDAAGSFIDMGRVLHLDPGSLAVTSSAYVPVWLPHAWAYSAETRMLVSGFTAETGLVMWNAGTGDIRWRGEPLDGDLHSCALSADGRTVLAGDTHGMVTLWEPPSVTPILSIDAHEGAWVDCCAFLGETGLALTGGNDGRTCVWRLADGAPVAVLPLDGHDPRCCAVDASGSLALVGDSAGQVLLLQPTGVPGVRSRSLATGSDPST